MPKLAGTADNNFVYNDVSGFAVTGVDIRAGTLWGKEDQDWFRFGVGDVLKDKAANELVN